MKGAVAATLLTVVILSPTQTGPVSAVPEPAETTISIVSVTTAADLTGVSFSDAAHGWAVGERGAILATVDGGASWAPQQSGYDGDLRAVSFADSTHGHAVGGSTILATADGGRTWAAQAPPPIESVPGDGPGRPDGARDSSWSFTAVSFPDVDHGIVLGGGGTVLLTDDGGQTWTWRGDRSFGFLSAVSFSDASNGVAVSFSGPTARSLFVSLLSSDSGRTWQAAGAGPHIPAGVTTANLRAAAAVDARRAYVGGDAGRIFVTSDGGATWDAQRHDTTETFNGLAFSRRDRGVAVGTTDFSDVRRASLATTADGGETWAPRLLDAAILWSAAFASRATAYAVGCAKPVLPQSPEGEGAVNCTQSLIVRIAFVDRQAIREGGGGFRWPLVLAAIGVVVATAVLVVWSRARSR